MMRLKSALGFAVGTVLCAVAVTAPASGAGLARASEQFSICDPMAGGSLLASASASTPGIAARGGTVREPDLGEVPRDLPARAKGKAGAAFTATIPVYMHVITDGTIGNVTDAEIAAEIAVLNKTYAGAEGGTNTGFSFALAGVTRTSNAAWFYAGPGGNDEHSMKRALHQGADNALNFYSTTAGPYLGWAFLPDITTKPGQAYLDGIVINWESIPGTSTTFAGKYDQGETATHEVGHWLNLQHTFEGGCNAKGDFVQDTPAELTPTSGCPTGKDTCPDPGLDPVHNYMDYSYDSCYTQFTPGQTQRMQDAWLFYRAT
jgi:hypothetical protein